MSASPSSPHRPGFLELVRAEELPTTAHWALRDWIAIAAVPLIFLGGWLVEAAT